MRKRNALNSPRLLELKRKKQKALGLRLLLALFGLVLLFGVFIYVTRIPRLNIKDVEIIGNKVASGGGMEEAVRRVLGGYYLWSIPKTNFLFYPKKEIENELAGNFKGLESIDINLNANQTLEVVVTERAATYTWCGKNLPHEGETENCYFVDSEGFLFSEAPYFSGNVYFKLYGDDLTTGGYYQKQFFPNIVLFKKNLEDMGLKPVALYAEDNGDMKTILAGKQNSSPEVFWKSDADVKKITENLETALSTEPLKSDFKNKYAGLEYLDLRFGSKVYYRFSAQGGPASGGQ